MLISRIAGTPIASKVAKIFTKCTGKSTFFNDSVNGVACKTNLKTGTRIINAETADNKGAKIINLGKGNRLRRELGINNITVYPKGSFVGGEEGLILCPADPKAIGWPMAINEFGKYVKSLEELKAEGMLA